MTSCNSMEDSCRIALAAICFGVTFSCCCGRIRRSTVGYLTPMIMRGEVVIALVAFALALIAISSFLSRRFARWRTPIATLGCVMAGLGPVLLFPYLTNDPTHATALWEWSAVGGPTIQASYRVD